MFLVSDNMLFRFWYDCFEQTLYIEPSNLFMTDLVLKLLLAGQAAALYTRACMICDESKGIFTSFTFKIHISAAFFFLLLFIETECQ